MTKKFLTKMFNPKSWSYLGYCLAEAGPIKTIVGFGRLLFKGTTAKENEEAMRDALYGTIAVISLRNVPFEHHDKETRRKLNAEYGYPQVPEDPKVSIISDSRDRFNKHISLELEQRLIFDNLSDFLVRWNQDFYGYVSKSGGFRWQPQGDFYLDSGKIYFKTERTLPPKPPTGNSMVVGGIMRDKK